MAKFDRDGCRVAQCLFEAAAWHYSIVADCKRCRACGVFHVAGLWRLFERKSWDQMFYAVAPRLRCRACGGRAALSVSRDAMPTVTLELPDEREWKRAVSWFLFDGFVAAFAASCGQAENRPCWPTVSAARSLRFSA